MRLSTDIDECQLCRRGRLRERQRHRAARLPPWTATNNDSFITITSGGNNSGSGTVNYNVDANTNTVVRIGTMTIAGQTFTVTQGAAP